MLKALSENLSIILERLLPSQDPDHPGEACLEEPNKLIQVVQRDVEGLGGDEDGPEVPLCDGSEWSPIFTGWDREVRVRV